MQRRRVSFIRLCLWFKQKNLKPLYPESAIKCSYFETHPDDGYFMSPQNSYKLGKKLKRDINRREKRKFFIITAI